ncbi:MAG: peptide chain release factor N(5)-glutamine methyltransferase [Deltaproteobacteria bacterium]|nr:peptide chain release factor N(5)-glutamine methyltransferase [Deltaproteobacteria bacterium]
MTEPWTISSIISWTTEDFKKRNIESPRLEAEILLCHVLKKQRLYLYTNFDSPLESDELARFKKLISKRREGVCSAAIIENKEFWSLDFYVNEDVLIPRADTEILVQSVLEQSSHAKNILDLCTGSGCIAISLATELKDAEFDAVDISEKALYVAKINCDRHEVNDRVNLLQGDLFEPLKEGKKYDVIVTNPPYVTSKQMENVSIEVRHEPQIALLGGGDDGLDIIKRILTDAQKYLTENGALFIELDDRQAEKTALELGPKYLNKEGTIIRDLSGMQRVVKF